MMAELIDRKRLKADVKTILGASEVPAKRFTALYLVLLLVLNVVDYLAGADLANPNLFGIFAQVLTGLVSVLLNAGFVLYCMAVRRGERSEFLTLFDGFSSAGKIIALQIVMYFFISLWSMLFVFPGIVAAYRYRFALYNLYENPDLSIFEALNMSKRQTLGYKYQLFALDLSYIGWMFLAGLPAMSVAYQAAGSVMAGGSAEELLAAAGGGILTMLLGSLWSLAVQLFYLPNMQTVELGYFEIAKRTSGVGANIDPDAGRDCSFRVTGGPDNLG